MENETQNNRESKRKLVEMDITKILEGYEAFLEEQEQIEFRLEELRNEIQKYVDKEGPVRYGRMRARYLKGRNKYNWENIVLIQEPDDALIQKYTNESVDWRKVASELGVPKEIKDRFTVQGKPKFVIEID